MPYTLTGPANTDITEIWFQIAPDGDDTADKVRRTILDNCELVAKTPGIGRPRHDLTRSDVRIWQAMPYKHYRIVYRATPKGVQILRVLHTARRKVWRSV